MGAGYSFGALVALDVAHPRLDAWLAVAPPLVMASHAPVAASDARPKLLLVAEHDQFCPPVGTAAATHGWPATTVETLDGADHFLSGHTAAVARRAATFVSALAAR